MRPAATAISVALLSASLLAMQAQAQTQDRYGPDAATTTLTWPGKTEPVDVVPPPPPAPPPLASAAVVAADAPAPVPPLMPPPPPASPIPVPYPTVGTAAVPSPPVAQPTQPAAVVQTGLPPHRYSVDRQYGVQPDPIPLPAQFFADQAATDLAAPPPPLEPRPVPGAQTVNSAASANTPANRARAIALDTASPDDTGQ